MLVFMQQLCIIYGKVCTKCQTCEWTYQWLCNDLRMSGDNPGHSAFQDSLRYIPSKVITMLAFTDSWLGPYKLSCPIYSMYHLFIVFWRSTQHVCTVNWRWSTEGNLHYSVPIFVCAACVGAWVCGCVGGCGMRSKPCMKSSFNILLEKNLSMRSCWIPINIFSTIFLY